ncbi:hypothetical protein SUGI_0360330 [Cryptomeria japonica]|nr:hypothetical protein SUGI_0360330 [Cryptomeria japonica]
MWENIVGRKKLEFQVHLEELLLEAPGYNTIITTRDSCIHPPKILYSIVSVAIAGPCGCSLAYLLLAFGQTSISSTANANLVMDE